MIKTVEIFVSFKKTTLMLLTYSLAEGGIIDATQVKKKKKPSNASPFRLLILYLG